MTVDIKQAVELARDWLGYGTRFGIAEEVNQGAITEEHLASVARALIALTDENAKLRAVVVEAKVWRMVEHELDAHARAGTEAPTPTRQAEWKTLDALRTAIDALETPS